MKPRQPNDAEKIELAYHVADSMGGRNEGNMEQANGFVEQSAIAVFDNYVTDCSGFAGKIMSVIWSVSPDFYEVFTWGRNGLRHLNQDKGFYIEPDDKPF